jgi:hypothetical protein
MKKEQIQQDLHQTEKIYYFKVIQIQVHKIIKVRSNHYFSKKIGKQTLEHLEQLKKNLQCLQKIS